MLARIISAAVLHNGIIHSMPKPNRHHHIVHAMNAGRESKLLHAEGVQGFLDADGNFLTREDAMVRAMNCGQNPQRIAPPKLYSEDLW